eukprot:4127812-Pleurochrysis_carterae.AAC.1
MLLTKVWPVADAPLNCAYALAPSVATAGRQKERCGIALPVEEYLVAQESQESRQVNRTLRRVSLHGGDLDLDGRNEGVDGIPMEVRTTVAAASAS